jgi:hypothetical protein
MPFIHKQSQLEIAYKKTNYVFSAPNVIRLNIGKPNPLVDKLFNQLNFSTGGFISACNPESKKTTPEKNRKANLKLEELLIDKVFFYGVGIDPDTEWKEESFMVLGIKKVELIELGRTFKQNAVIYVEKGHAPELVWTDVREKSS